VPPLIARVTLIMHVSHRHLPSQQIYVVFKTVAIAVFVGERNKLIEFVVGVARGAIERINVRQQAPFGVVFQLDLGGIWLDDFFNWPATPYW
jgi:hypothetical protein